MSPGPAHVAPVSFRTVRLIAERVAPQHADALIALHADAEAMQWIHGTATAAETREWVDEKAALWTSHGFGPWVLSLAEAGAAGRPVVGRAGLQLCDEGEPGEVELVYLLGSRWWGRGLATEASRAVLGIAFDHLLLPKVVATTKLSNAPSQHVLAKLGFIRGRLFEHEGEQWVLYRLQAPHVD